MSRSVESDVRTLGRWWRWQWWLVVGMTSFVFVGGSVFAAGFGCGGEEIGSEEKDGDQGFGKDDLRFCSGTAVNCDDMGNS